LSGPSFGGMSGVVYGFLGYAWIKGKIEPRMGLALHQQTVIIMGAWLLLGIVGVLGSIANGAHVFGLIAGIVLGFKKSDA